MRVSALPPIPMVMIEEKRAALSTGFIGCLPLYALRCSATVSIP